MLGKLGLPEIEGKCDLTGDDEKLKGDPGSIYQICCPADCEKKNGIIWGQGIFAEKSNICQAAIFSGIINNGGCFVY